METRHIKNFLELAKTEHVSQTADLLNISQPSLSKSIAALEEELGVKLFDRAGNRIHLNENGIRFAEYARQSMEWLNGGIKFLKQNTYETLGHVSIKCWAFAPIMQACAAEYSSLNPYINFKISQNSEEFAGDQEKTDFVLSARAADTTSGQMGNFWITQQLFCEEYVLVAAPGHFKQLDDIPPDAETIDLSVMREASFVMMFQKNMLFSDVTYELCQNAGFFPKTYCQTDDFLIKIAMIRSGIAVAFLPESCLEYACLLCPGLRHFHLQDQCAQRSVYLLRPKKALMSEAALDFYDFVLDYFHLPPDERD